MAAKDEVKVGDIVEVIVPKPLTGKSAEALKQQGYAKPNRLGQRARVSALQQTSKAGDVIWTTKKDGKILIKYIAYDHPEGYSLPDQPPGKPPALNDGEWKIVEKAEVPEGAERARDEEGKFEPDDPNTDDENEAYEPSSTKSPASTSDDDSDDSDDGEPSSQPTQGFGEVSQTIPTSAQEPQVEVASGENVFYCPKANNGKPMTSVFDVQGAGWTPIVNTREIDVDKIKEAQGSKTIVINEQGFGVRLLFSPKTNALDNTLIDSLSKYDNFLKDSANMVVREYIIGSKLKKTDIVGSGNKAESITSNNRVDNAAGDSVNQEFPPSAQVTSMTLTFGNDGRVQQLMVDLLDRAGGDNQDYNITHKIQGSSFAEATVGGFGGSGFGPVESVGGGMTFTPALNQFNQFYNSVDVADPVQRFLMSIEIDADNAVFRDYWKPMTVRWDEADSIKVNLVDGKNIGGYIKMQMVCEAGDTTDLIPGRWVDFTSDSPRNSWSKYPRSAVVIFPYADDTTMRILSDDGEKMGPIQEVQYHKVGDAIAQIRLISEFEREVVDEEGNVVLEDPDDDFSDVKKETVRLMRTIEKGQDVSFEVRTRKGVGIQGRQTLKGEVSLFTAYPNEECDSAWDKRKGQRFSFLSLGQQTLTYLRHQSSDDGIDRYYIIVANKAGEPHTGQVIVVEKSQADVEEPASYEEDIVPEEDGE